MNRSLSSRPIESMGKQINAVVWSSDEKKMLLDLYDVHNDKRNKWRLMSKQLKRSNASIRNCFRRIDPNRLRDLRAQYTRPPNTCQKCGEMKRGHVCQVELHHNKTLNARPHEYNIVRMKLNGSEAPSSDAKTERAQSPWLDHSYFINQHITNESPPLSPTCSVRSVSFEELDQLCDDLYTTET